MGADGHTIDVHEAIRTTRAIRRFTDEPVTDAEILTCLRAAVQAPSGGNIQPWQFLVVTDPGQKHAIGALYRRAYDRYERALLDGLPPFRTEEDEASFMRSVAASRHLAEHLGEAPALVLFLMFDISMALQDADGVLDVGTPYASVYPAVQNFMLAARGLGIGTTLTTVYRIHHDELRALCAVPDHFQVVALVPMGRPRGRFAMARRRPAEAMTHWDRYGNRR
jgi:nitroreductase